MCINQPFECLPAYLGLCPFYKGPSDGLGIQLHLQLGFGWSSTCLSVWQHLVHTRSTNDTHTHRKLMKPNETQCYHHNSALPSTQIWICVQLYVLAVSVYKNARLLLG